MIAFTMYLKDKNDIPNATSQEYAQQSPITW